MNHSFSKSHFHNNCAVCNQSELMHTDQAKCEVCDSIGSVNQIDKILMCVVCEKAEVDARLNIINAPSANVATDKILADVWKCDNCSVVNNIFNKECVKCHSLRPSSLDSLVSADKLLLHTAKEIDKSVVYRTDLFTAATVSIQAIKEAIDSDNSIENKNYELAKILKERFEHFQQVIFSANEVAIEGANNQKAIQVYLNNLANKLRSEEREKLKLADITYQVAPVGPIKSSSIKVSKPKPKFDKADIKKWALALSNELGKPVPEFMLQTVAVSNNCNAEEAANILRKNIKESLSMS